MSAGTQTCDATTEAGATRGGVPKARVPPGGHASVVLEGAREVPADEAAGEVAVRFALTRAVLSPGEVLVVARSRGRRLPDGTGR
ncbi:hypothetical protein RB625_27625 [Streptomyces californicus]|uniref:hypothetical protein n=1 Tax=Streptomyces californicus TaxID=67351 RepID=UPI00296F6DC0|nr:hypothetical protein [Streptomyces californicus]MDW4902194.1 hypothetical protein [Streptomyces californicus]